MKQRIFALALCLLLLSAFALNASASSYLPMVVDSAELLSGEERIALEETAESFRTEYELDVVVLTVDSLDGKTAQRYADDYYDDNGYGYGENYSGLLFLLAMEEREWYISTCGDAVYLLSDYSLEQIGETVVPFLSVGQYYDGFVTLYDTLPAYLSSSKSDGHEQVHTPGYREEAEYYQPRRQVNILISLVIGIVVAAVVVIVMRASMNTKRKQRSAGDYLRSGSYHLRTKQDMFLYSNVTKVRRQQNNNTGGRSGSSSHRSSGGSSHGGRGGRF